MRRFHLIRSHTAAVAIATLVAGLQTFEPAFAALPVLQAQSSTEQMVTVTVVPHDLAAKSWEFEVTLTTHVQPLGDDMVKASALVDAAGKRHEPLAWRGDGPGGHHRKGVLVFAPVEPRPQSIELQIQRSVEPAPRSFKWHLQ